MARVEFTDENFTGCMCPGCQVRNESSCALDQEQKIEAGSMSNLPSGDGSPRVFCAEAVDGTNCSDFDGDKPCICGSCPVWAANGLTSGYYCTQGGAEKIG